ncbi:hypothetical protein JCM10450v2_000491 [Rhodotorula kratochvilovae]
MRRARLDAPIPLLAYTTLFLALLRLPTAFALLDARSSSPQQHDVSRAALRFKQHKIPHYSHRPPGTKRQNTAQGLLCALGVASACENSSGPAIDTSSDRLNCGAVGNICPSSFPNSAGPVVCQAGQCVSGCVLGYNWDFASSSCINTASDPANCGVVGRLCTTPTGTTSVACVAGMCVATECARGFSLSGGSCAAVPFAADANNCGAVGAVCPESFPHGQGSMCADGQCRPERCDEGYDWDEGAAACVDVRSDAANCVRANFLHERDVVPDLRIHIVGALRFLLPSYIIHSVDTSRRDIDLPLWGPLPNCRPARRALRLRQLCPPGLTACPILHSASLAAAAAAARTTGTSWSDLVRALAGPLSAAEATRGGYECLDTGAEAESCGGCAASGEGEDCTLLPRARATGCEGGRCVVFACEGGWTPARDGRGCVKAGREKRGRHREGRRRLH